MRRSVVTLVLLLASFLTASASAQTASWQKIIGIALANNVVGSGTGAITGGFLPWNALDGKAHVNLATGETRFFVRGLVFAAGAPGITIGTPGPITAVKGTLICNASGTAGGGNSVIVETPSVPLSSTGNAEFSGNIGPLPAVCSSQPDLVFVLRVSGLAGNAVEGPWIANGTPLSEKTDQDGD